MRDFAQVRLSIWNDDAFRALSVFAQHLYFMLLSHPSLSYCGVGDWRPARLAALAADWKQNDVRAAAIELALAHFIVLDDETEEFLVRSFVRNDPLMRQKNLATSMARAFSTVGSDTIRGVIVHELKRLKRDAPNLGGWRSPEAMSLLSKPEIDPKAEEFSPKFPKVGASVDPSSDPKISEFNPEIQEIRASIDPSVNPSAACPVTPKFQNLSPKFLTPTTATATTTNRNDLREGERHDGGKGVKGGKGEDPESTPTPETESAPTQTSFGDSANAPTADDDHLDPLDALAAKHQAALKHGTPDQWSTPEDPRCHAHRNTPAGQVPNCGGCADARRWFQARAADAKTRRRSEIDACDECDSNGMAYANGIARRCTHGAKPTPPF